MTRAPDRIVLRYFDCLGRAQPLRNALVDAGVAFDDERISIGPSWRTVKEQAEGGPFGSLPCAATIADRFGKCSTAQHGNIASLSPTDVTNLTAYLETL
jgi:hypothetical protein